MKTKFKDMFGTTMEVGDFFTCAMRRGNSSEIALGIVLGEGRCGLEVWNVKGHWGDIELNTKKSVICGGSNMIWYPAESVPDAWRNALSDKLTEYRAKAK